MNKSNKWFNKFKKNTKRLKNLRKRMILRRRVIQVCRNREQSMKKALRM